MNDEFNYTDDPEMRRRDARELRRKRRRQQRRRAVIIQCTVFAALAVLLVCVSVVAFRAVKGPGDESKSVSATPKTEQQNQESEAQSESQTESQDSSQAIKEEAALLAAGYDYDGAIELLKTIPGYETDGEVTEAIRNYEETKATCVAVDVDTVPHIFYHSLVNDPERAFDAGTLGQGQADGMNAWMTTVEEFDKITQQMYENGYVFVRLRDLVVETEDENGNVTFTKNTNLMLPPDKKPVVLSVDDLSYYHSYEAASFPDKLVLDENGKVKCHYVKPDGTEEVGDFDVVPRLEFLPGGAS